MSDLPQLDKAAIKEISAALCNYKYHENCDRGYDHAATEAAWKRLREVKEKYGISILQAEEIHWANRTAD